MNEDTGLDTGLKSFLVFPVGCVVPMTRLCEQRVWLVCCYMVNVFEQEEAAAERRLGARGDNGRVQPQHGHHVHSLPQRVPHLGARKVSLSTTAPFPVFFFPLLIFEMKQLEDCSNTSSSDGSARVPTAELGSEG